MLHCIRTEFFIAGSAPFITPGLDTQPNLFRHCPLCGADEPESFLQKQTLRLVRCSRCSMVYANPVPAELGSGQYYDSIGSQYYLSAAKLQSDYSPVRFERELKIFRKYVSGGAVLDVGCSSGAFLFQLGARFQAQYHVLGIDTSGPPIEYAISRGIPCVRGNFLEQHFDQAPFDAITFWAVLEHLADPKAFLTKAAHLLRPDGYCFVLVPNLKSLASRFLGSRYRYIYPQHLNYFTRKTLTRLLSEDFSLLESKTTHFNPLVIWQDWRRKEAEVSNRQRADLLKRTTALKLNPILLPVRKLYSLTEKVLGVSDLADNLLFVLQKRKL